MSPEKVTAARCGPGQLGGEHLDDAWHLAGNVVQVLLRMKKAVGLGLSGRESMLRIA